MCSLTTRQTWRRQSASVRDQLTVEMYVFVSLHSVCAVVDSKCSYPAACNAMESLLVHSALLDTSAFHTLTSSLKANGVSATENPNHVN